MRTEFDEIKDILIKNNITDIEEIEYGSDAFSDLFEYFSSDPDGMPYGVQKARTGMPDEWIYERLCDLGFDKPDPAVNHDKHQGREDAHSHLDEEAFNGN